MQSLSARETEVLRLVALGYSNVQIGKLLSISHRTVDTHRTNIKRKLQLGNLADMIRYALKNGIVE